MRQECCGQKWFVIVAAVQRHLMRFATVDLAAPSSQIIERLKALVEASSGLV